MTSSHTHTQAHHFLGRLSQLNCFPTMTENNRGKKNLYRVGWWGKKHFPLFNFFSKEAGGPHCCVQPKPEEGERTLLYTTTTTYTTPPTRWFSCGQVSLLLYFYYTILPFFVSMSVSTSRGENASRNGTKESSSLPSSNRREPWKFSRITRGLKKLSGAGTLENKR